MRFRSFSSFARTLGTALRTLGVGLLLLFLGPLSLHAQVDSTTVDVKDAGSSIVNGSYTCPTDLSGNCNTVNGRPEYENDSNSDIVIRWDGSFWVIRDVVSLTTYYENTTDQYRPPETGWSVFSGTSPAPTLSYGSDTSGPPVAYTEAASSVSTGSVQMNGRVNPQGNSTTVTFYYAEAGGSFTPIEDADSPLTGTTEQDVNQKISGLSPGTEYEFAVHATNSAGNDQGQLLTFTTDVAAPTATTEFATNVTDTEAQLNGRVNPGGESATVEFEYWPTGSPGSAQTVTASQSPINGTYEQDVSASISNLSANTDYTYQVTATNNAGVGSGSEETFTAGKSVVAEIQEDALLRASNAEKGDIFGESVAIDGDRAIVGASGEDGASNNKSAAGAAYILERSGGTWQEVQVLRASNAESEDAFGESVAIDGDRVIVGAKAEDAEFGSENANSGAAYVFERSDGSWQEVQVLRASNTDEGDLFGESVAIDGDWAIVGASNEDGPSNSGDNVGAAYVFKRSGGSWPKNENQILRPSTPESFDSFGSSVAISGDRAIVGARGAGSKFGAGGAYVFERSDGTWQQMQYLTASNPDRNDDFGFSVAIDGGRAIVGAIHEDGPSNVYDNVGAAYVFEESGGSWTQDQVLRSSDATWVDQFFGWSVAIDGDRAVVGTPFSNGPSNITDPGEAYLFERSTTGWEKREDTVFRASNAGAEDDFGLSVAISGKNVMAGALHEDGLMDGKDDAGAVYTFQLALAASASSTVDADGPVRFSGTGTEINFSGVSGSSEVTVKTYDEGPSTTDGISESNVSTDRVTITSDLSFNSAEVRLSVSAFDGINDPSNVTIYKRSEGASSFTDLTPTEVDENGTPNDASDDEVYASTGSFSEFVLASDSEALPVELTSFEGTTMDGGVRLTWQTAAETNNAGFRVQRRVADATAPNGNRTGEGKWTQVGRRAGSGTTTEAQSYRFEDADLPPEADRLTYRLKQVDIDGTTSFSKEVTVERGAVTELQLQDTYPNPARTEATVRYAVPERSEGEVTLRLYDVLGRQVRTVPTDAKAGRHKHQLDTNALSSGVYFLRLQAGGTVKTQRLTVVR